MRTVVAAIFTAALATGASAATVLRYDFDAVITSTQHHHSCFGANMLEACSDYEHTSYEGPAVSSRGAGWMILAFEDRVAEYNEYWVDEMSYSILGLPDFFQNAWIEGDMFDSLTKSIAFMTRTLDHLLSIKLDLESGLGGGFL